MISISLTFRVLSKIEAGRPDSDERLWTLQGDWRVSTLPDQSLGTLAIPVPSELFAAIECEDVLTFPLTDF